MLLYNLDFSIINPVRMKHSVVIKAYEKKGIDGIK